MSATLSYLEKYQGLIEKIIQESIPFLGPKSELRDACEYALTNGGKRIRPAFVLIMSKALGFHSDAAWAALAIEYFHTASLIADDLPCMDNDHFRRNKPTLHKVYGEGTALLASYALISAGYECLARNAELIKNRNLPFSANSDRICVAALSNASTNTGLWGASAGQFMDMNASELSLELVKEIIHKKTSSLFEIAFVFGWVFGGGALDRLEDVKKAARHFGLAFQVADDIGDEEQDRLNGRLVNVSNIFGRDAAIRIAKEETNHYLATLKHLHLEKTEMEDLANLIYAQLSNYL